MIQRYCGPSVCRETALIEMYLDAARDASCGNVSDYHSRQMQVLTCFVIVYQSVVILKAG